MRKPLCVRQTRDVATQLTFCIALGPHFLMPLCLRQTLDVSIISLSRFFVQCFVEARLLTLTPVGVCICLEFGKFMLFH
jgi:hypothetical protein